MKLERAEIRKQKYLNVFVKLRCANADSIELNGIIAPSGTLCRDSWAVVKS